MSRIIRATATGALALAVVAGATTAHAAPATPGASHVRVAPPVGQTDPAVTAGSWLVSQLVGNLVPSPFGGSDYGLSIDTALALDATDQQPKVVKAISGAVAAKIESYISGAAFGDTGSTYAGATAKALVLAETAKADPKAYGGVDLVSRLEGQVSTAPATLGRISDTSMYGDYANTLGQAYAATGLELADSPRAADATSYLLEQQCPDGWFRLSFSDPTAADQSCDPATDAASTDVTSIAVIELLQQRESPGVYPAVKRAESWLAKTQGKDGSFGSDAPTTAPNANSTGLAGWALGAGGRGAKAAAAATWVREHQLLNVARCRPNKAADVGALAYDDTAYAAGLTAKTADQFRRATAQALPVLAYAPPASPGFGGGGYQAEFYRPGGKVTLELSGEAPGTEVCGFVGSNAKSGTVVFVDAARKAAVTLTLPRSTGSYLIKAVTAAGGSISSHAQVLGKQAVSFALAKAAIATGGTQTVRVHGLVRYEYVRVHYRGNVVAHGQVNGQGKIVLSFPVGAKPGSYPVTVTGQFQDLRSGTKTFKVTS